MGFRVPDLRPRSVWVSRRLPLRIGEETQQAARFGWSDFAERSTGDPPVNSRFRASDIGRVKKPCPVERARRQRQRGAAGRVVDPTSCWLKNVTVCD